MSSQTREASLDRAIASFVGWLDRFGEESYDPHDVWAWSVGRRAKRLYYERPLAGKLAAAPLVGLDLLLPRLRRFVVSPHRYPIADAHFALGFFDWALTTGDIEHEARGRHFLEALERTRSPGYDEYCWGYPFDWESRTATIPAQTPLITTIPYAYEAFEVGHEMTGDARYLEIMESIARFAYERIPVTRHGNGTSAAAYTPSLRSSVVNASCYRGFLLIAAGRRFERDDWIEAGEQNVQYALSVQRDDGSWPYAPTAGDEFVDNFHTCLVLKNLLKIAVLSTEGAVFESVRRGFAFYRDHLLDDARRPVPFAVAPRLTLYRGDLYDYAEALSLAVLLVPYEPTAAPLVDALIGHLVADWELPDGHFVTKKLIVGRQTIPYHRWAQAQMFRALALARRRSAVDWAG